VTSHEERKQQNEQRQNRQNGEHSYNRVLHSYHTWFEVGSNSGDQFCNLCFRHARYVYGHRAISGEAEYEGHTEEKHEEVLNDFFHSRCKNYGFPQI